jgi:hypothetical protein
MDQKVRAVYVCMSDHITVEKIAMQYHADSYDCYFAFLCFPFFSWPGTESTSTRPARMNLPSWKEKLPPTGA